tara:strand:- start:137 stop:496 length:360 start_codon:yes stop_codon:yes gene_type:complete
MSAEEKFTLWEYGTVMTLRREVRKLFNRVKVLMRQHVYQESSALIQKKIVPLLCEYYVTLHNYLEYLERLSEDDNVIFAEGKRKVVMTLEDIKVLQVLSSSRLICEYDLAIYNISMDMH